MRRHGWSAQVPVRQVLERDEDAVAVWKAEVWPEIKARRATWAPSSPYALVSFSSVMIPVSRSAARCARYPSRRASRGLAGVPGIRIHGRDHPVLSDLLRDPPPAVPAVAAPGGLDVLPGDQGQQRHRRGRRLVQLR
jgi:hypothetical protein